MTILRHPGSDRIFIGDPRSIIGTGADIINAEDLPAGTRIQVGLGESEVLPSFDFETYSEAGFTIDPITGKVRGIGPQGKGGLPVVGTPVYAEHPSTEILCLYYNLKDSRGRQAWYPGTPDPLPLIEYILSGGLIEAYNITFEFWIWNIIGVRLYGWPPLPLAQCRCAMAKARRHSLAGKLATNTKILGTPQKDPAGDKLVRKLTRPHTPTKNRAEHRHTPQNAWADFLALYDYCDQDTVAEDNVSAHIPDLSLDELATWQLDQTINARGVQVDMAALDAAIDILGQTERKYTAELSQLTKGAVNSVSEVAKFGEWLATYKIGVFVNDGFYRDESAYQLPDMQKDTIADALKDEHLPPQARRALEIRAVLGAANVKKLRTLKLQVSSDGRLRDQYMYCGADRTGRASAGGVQLQNITAKGPKTCECEGCGKIFGLNSIDGRGPSCPRCGSFMLHTLPEWTIEAVEQAIEDIAHRDLSFIEHIWGDPIALLCGCLRGLFIAKEGHKLVCCDFSAIEAVAAACLARCQWRIDVFNTHGLIYEMSAAKTTGKTLEYYIEYRQQFGHHHEDRKKVGKIFELALQYGGWIGACRAFGSDMPDDELKRAILAWREASPEIIEMWGGQFRWCGPGKWDYRPELFGLEGAVINAILHPGQCFSHIDITYGVWDDILFCRLPSGRYLHYHRPRLSNAQDKLNRGPSYQITFEGYNSNSTKGPIGWHRMETYGGRLFENVVQAVSADIQFEALKRCEAHRYPIAMHTHDEGSAEVPVSFGSVPEMAAIMSERPAWASWWPLKAAGWEHKRYQKD